MISITDIIINYAVLRYVEELRFHHFFKQNQKLKTLLLQFFFRESDDHCEWQWFKMRKPSTTPSWCAQQYSRNLHNCDTEAEIFAVECRYIWLVLLYMWLPSILSEPQWIQVSTGWKWWEFPGPVRFWTYKLQNGKV